MAAKLIIIVPGYHMDIVWRRPPEEQRRLRELQLEAAMEMLAGCPEFCFEFDQAIIIREYLERHPERLEGIRRYVRGGRVEINGGGESIPDNNLVSGEGLVRNLLSGRLWFEETLGATATVANYDDAFGQTFQLPQIMRGFGDECFRDTRLPGLDMQVARHGVLWEGIDGSRVFYLPSHGGMTEYTHICNLDIVYEPEERLQASLEELIAQDLAVVFGRYCSEEELVNEHVVDTILACVASADVELRFGLCSEVMAAARKANPMPKVVRGEFNPTLQGTHISRISLKQAYRRAEWATRAAEVVATSAMIGGAGYPREQFVDMWRKLSYVQFHDSICGCHSDEVNRKVMRYCREVTRAAEAIQRRSARALVRTSANNVTSLNPLPFPYRAPVMLDLPDGRVPADATGQALPAEKRGDRVCVVLDQVACGVTTLDLVPGRVAAPRARPAKTMVGQALHVGTYEVTPEHERLAIARNGHVLACGPFPEVRFRHEDGGLWLERYLGPVYGESSGERRLVRVEEGPVTTRLTWEGRVSGADSPDPLPPIWQGGANMPFRDLQELTWEKELIFYRELERIDVTVRMDFKGKNTEILLGFPLQLDLATTHMLYDVPFAAVERRPYFELESDSPEVRDAPLHLAKLGGTGHYPALDWVAYGDDQWGMVLANQGTPAHRLMNGEIEVIVLRSPTTIESGLYPPPGSRENGHHEFRFALQPYQGDPFSGGAYRLGQCLNAPPITAHGVPKSEAGSLVSIDAPGVVLSCLKPAERGEGIIIRTYETRGERSRGRVTFSQPVAETHGTDLMERPQKAVAPRRLTWRPYEIKTLRLVVQDA